MAKTIKRVRIIVRGPDGAVLLMQWRDPVSGRQFWEPPGGGIQAGESPIEAARRELYEETGLTLDLDEAFVEVAREYVWAGKSYAHVEAFFFATTTSIIVALTDPTPRELETLVEMRFLSREEIAELVEPLEPAELAAITDSGPLGVALATIWDELRDANGTIVSICHATDLASPVPTCPGWTLDELLWHLGGIHRWFAHIVGDAVAEFGPDDRSAIVGPRPGSGVIIPWFAEGADELVRVLEEAPDDLECWVMFSDTPARRMWSRRMAYEAAIHRVDVELAAGQQPRPFSPVVGADMIDELLGSWTIRNSRFLLADPPVTLEVECTDISCRRRLAIGEGRTLVVADGSDATCTVRGSASDIALVLWTRSETDAVEITGDPGVLDLFRQMAYAKEAR